MGNLVFQATLGGQVNLVGPNTASTYNLNVPAVAGTLVTTGDTGTVTNTMLASNVYTAPGTIGSVTPNTGAFTTLSASGNITASGGTANGVTYLNASKVLTSGSALTFDGTNLYNSGRTGLGVANTSGPTLKIDKLSGSDQLSFYESGVDLWHVYTSASGLGFYYNPGASEIMRLTSTGLGIGTTSSTSRLTVKASGSTYAAGALALVGSSSGTTYITNAGGKLYFSNDGSTDQLVLDASGNLLVGKTALNDTTAGAQIAGSSATYPGRICATVANSTNATEGIVVYSSSAGAYRFYVSMNGTISATSTTISAISDIRFKENVRDLDAGLDKIMALKPRLYDWKEGKGANIKNARGFIAQEFEQVFPDLIDEWKDPAPEGEDPYKSVRQDLIPVLVKAIQEQQAIIEEMKSRLAAAGI